jgi:hypothetical protein
VLAPLFMRRAWTDFYAARSGAAGPSDLCKCVRTTAILFKHFSVTGPIKRMPSLGVSSLDLGR